nr:MAG TPA: Protein of unknown function (DUF2634) [Caudoviricetes sp.]
MIPNNENYEDFDDEENDGLDTEFDMTSEPSLTYRLDVDNKRIIGRIDDIEAIKQAILLILQTERYKFEMYSWDYGFEMEDLRGASIPYVMSEVKQRLIDALTADDRIESLEDFKITKTGKNTLYIVFTVITTQEDEFEMESEVEI